VTEGQWLSCEDPRKQVEWLRGVASERKLRLFACAFWRWWWQAWTPAPEDGEPDRDLLRLLDFAEQWAEQATRPEGTFPGGFGWHPLVARHAADAANWTVRQTAGSKARLDCLRYEAKDRARAAAEQSRLLREMFGNPFGPPPGLTPSCRTPVVLSLAQAAYDHRELPAGTLDLARLAELADALEDAGCTDAGPLAHLRAAGPHVRGCWAVDAVLGKP
jgi:hypothetical protein